MEKIDAFTDVIIERGRTIASVRNRTYDLNEGTKHCVSHKSKANKNEIDTNLPGDCYRLIRLWAIVIQEYHWNSSCLKTGDTMSRCEYIAIVDQRTATIETIVVLQKTHPWILIDDRLVATNNAIFLIDNATT